MGAINKTYGPLPQQLASTSKPVAARRQHGCRRAADHCLFLRLELRIDVHRKISNPTAKSSVTTDQHDGSPFPPNHYHQDQKWASCFTSCGERLLRFMGLQREFSDILMLAVQYVLRAKHRL